MGFTWVDARYFDGLSAQRRQVFVSLDVESQRLTIHDHLGADLDIWPLEGTRLDLMFVIGFGKTENKLIL